MTQQLFYFPSLGLHVWGREGLPFGDVWDVTKINKF